ncbi:MAG TPA: penicillin-binding protein 2 [Thiobacillaceae bacterium]|nr:penicillin-binding protein 2 [Thiobacillaceae bacterium]HNU63800.1 penicillin-binding protein 2 [Thiobacillaceae bacterium]
MRPRLINPEEEFQRYRRRMEIGVVLVILALLGLFVRFIWLQVVQYERYRALAEENRISLVPAPPSRGVIYDRMGVVLARNFTASTLEITPSKAGRLDEVIDELARIVRIEPGDRKRFRKLLAESRNFESLPIRNMLSEEEAARFAVNRYRFPGVEVKARLFRQYPFGESFAHVVGYIGRIGQRDLDRLEAQGRVANYKGSDHIGKLGVEASHEEWLHGRTGIEKVETDSGGHAVRVLSRTPPVSGHNLWLYLDSGLQQVAEKVFGDYRGALVALDPRTGGVLALVSKPGFDPNLFVDGIDTATWKVLNDAFERPLINRALRGVYPPGSTIKPFMGLAGLELGLRRPGDTISDPGYFSLPGSSHRYRDWKKDGHGTVDLKKSIVVSCDTYYYGLARDMGIERMADFLGRFGFGRKSGVDLDGELSGLMPTPAWKQRRFKQPWWPGETVIAGIGQGYVLASPMQLAVATMALANNGVMYKPQLVQAWQDPLSGKVVRATPRVVDRLALHPRHLQVVREAMVGVLQPGGTAAGAGAGAAYLIAGKTGTAQVKGIKQGARYVESQTAAHHRDHALFIAYAPADNPKIALAVMVENGGHGSSTAAPIARKVMDYWLLGKLPGLSVSEEQARAAPQPQEEQEDSGLAEEPAAAEDVQEPPR